MGRKLVVGVFTPSVVLAVARSLGRLWERDLEGEEVLVPSSPSQLPFLLSGDLDIALTSPDNVVAYRLCPDNPLGTRVDVSVVAAVDRGLGLADVCSPYIGTVLSIANGRHLHTARDLSAALRRTAHDIHAGKAEQHALEQAESVLALPADLAQRYVRRLKSPDEGLVTDEHVDLDAMSTVIGLRRKYLPNLDGGVDSLACALDASSGLIASVARQP